MIDMTEGKPSKLIIRFALPLLAGNILQQMYNLVDSIIVGSFVGKEALAAVGNSFLIMFFLISLFGGIALGTTILISQYFGAKEYKKIKAVIDTVYIAMSFIALFVTIIGFFSSDFILRLLNTPDGKTFEMSKIYLQTLFLGTIANFGYNINAGFLQGLGDSKTSLLFLAIATAINIALDLLFVIVFDMGVFGVALATIVAQSISFIFGLLYINKKIPLLKVNFLSMQFNQTELSKTVKIGLPIGMQNMLFSLGAMALQRLINGYGPDFMAGYSAVNKIDPFVFMPILSFSMALTTYVGQNVGAKRLDRVYEGVKSSLLITLSVTALMSIFVFIFGKPFLMSFTKDESVIQVGLAFIHRLMPAYILLPSLFMINSSIRGLGNSIAPLFISMVSMFIIRIPAAYILDLFWGKYAIFHCYLVGWIVGNTVAIPYFFYDKKKRASELLKIQTG
ncbi:MAG: MATE family efflux transporter [Treponemataceae bacterium]